MPISEIVIALLLLGGSFFGFTAALGLIRMPDTYIRMSTSGKAATLCCGLLLAAVALLFRDAQVTARAVAAILFLLLTVPVGAHMIARAAYRVKNPMWEGTEIDRDLHNGANSKRGDGGSRANGRGESGRDRGERNKG